MCAIGFAINPMRRRPGVSVGVRLSFERRQHPRRSCSTNGGSKSVAVVWMISGP